MVVAFGPAVSASASIGSVPTGTTVAVDPFPSPDIFVTDDNHVWRLPGDGSARTAVGTGLLGPRGVAVDAAGDVFIADSSTNKVVKVPAGGGAQTTIGTGLSVPAAVAVDAAGDVFIADSNNHRVVKVPAGGGAQTTVGTGLSLPTSVAVDAAGDVYIGDEGNKNVVCVPAGGGAQTTVGTGLDVPHGVAVDAAGNVYIGDYNHNRVVKVPAGGGTQTTVGTGLSVPYDVAVDAAGDVYIDDYNNNRVVKVPADGGPQTSLNPGLAAMYSVAVNSPAASSLAGDSVSLTATVQTSPSGGLVTGDVSFSNGSTHLGTVPVTGSGNGPYIATLNTAALPAGTNHVTAAYLGDATNAASTDSAPVTVNVTAPPAPTVTGVSPSAGPVTGGQAITVTGSGFSNGATVKIGQGGSPAIPATNVNVDSATQITATTGGGAVAGRFHLYVTVPGAGTSLSTADNWYRYQNVQPTVTGVSPNSGPTTGGQSITVTGTGFVSGTTVKSGQGGNPAIPATNVVVVTPTQITATTGGGATAGKFHLVVTVPGAAPSAANPSDFYRYSNPQPTVTAVSPNSGPTTGGQSITVTGTGFVTGATVKIGQGSNPAIPATNVVVVTPTQITATTGGGATAGTFHVVVTVPGAPASVATTNNRYTYQAVG
ncbi:MAG: IPT/TIG domain-containing protein [Frankiaceae bacterium]|nr:IPT/TIG domain-containing protein [Frankiaceae bacterium]